MYYKLFNIFIQKEKKNASINIYYMVINKKIKEDIEKIFYKLFLSINFFSK